MNETEKKAVKNCVHDKKSELFKFLGWNIIKLISFLFLIILLIYVTEKYIVDIDSLFKIIVNNLSVEFVFILFFISESFLGLIPPDIFIIWAKQFDLPFLILTVLAVLSYTGGIISYKIGRWISERPKIKEYLEKKYKKIFMPVKKWGGVIIIIAAIFPYSPYSMFSIVAGVLRFPFMAFVIFGLARFLRFYLYAFFLFKILN